MRHGGPAPNLRYHMFMSVRRSLALVVVPPLSAGSAGDSAAPSATGYYKRKHNPWVNWQDPGIPLPYNKLPASVNMPLAGYFPVDYSTLPALCFVIPNQLHDMHDGTIAQGDQWLQ